MVPTRTQVLILRHHREVTRSSNTGRLAALALPSCRIAEYGAPGAAPVSLAHELVGVPVGPGAGGGDAALLFPGGEELAPGAAPAVLVVLDGTWSQVRRMRRKVHGLDELRKVSLPPVSTLTPRLRVSPGEGKVSTLEAIAYALGVLEGPAVQEALLGLFQVAVQRSVASGRQGIALRGAPAPDAGGAAPSRPASARELPAADEPDDE